jgi:hypothetical protein
MRYGLNDLIAQDREHFPDGQTFGLVKAVQRNHVKSRATIDLRVVNISPEEYLESYKTCGGLIAVTRTLVALDLEPTTTARDTRKGSVEAVHFMGSVISDSKFVKTIEAVGAYVPGEKGTGYLHIIEAGENELFKRRDKTKTGLLDRLPIDVRRSLSSTEENDELKEQILGVPNSEGTYGSVVNIKSIRASRRRTVFNPDDHPSAS